MNQNASKISSATKAKILAELEAPGRSVLDIAKSYNVSTTSIYNWHKEKEAQELAASTNNFVELSLKETEHISLQKASLIFDNFSLIIEGKLNTKTLTAIIHILEEQSC